MWAVLQEQLCPLPSDAVVKEENEGKQLCTALAAACKDSWKVGVCKAGCVFVCLEAWQMPYPRDIAVCTSPWDNRQGDMHVSGCLL